MLLYVYVWHVEIIRDQDFPKFKLSRNMNQDVAIQLNTITVSDIIFRCVMFLPVDDGSATQGQLRNVWPRMFTFGQRLLDQKGRLDLHTCR
jgi:hypothetical protein